MFFGKKIEGVHNWPFPGHLGLLLAVCHILLSTFVRSQTYDFDAIAHIGP